MAEQSLTPENLESYSTEAISNFSKAIEDFADLIIEIKSEDANIAVFNSIYVMIDGRKRRLADIANIEAPNDPLNLEVMVYSRDYLETVINTINISHSLINLLSGANIGILSIVISQSFLKRKY